MGTEERAHDGDVRKDTRLPDCYRFEVADELVGVDFILAREKVVNDSFGLPNHDPPVGSINRLTARELNLLENRGDFV